MNVFAGWIRRRPVAAFYLICFTLSWGLWLPYILTRAEVLELLAIVGLFGPALACVIVSRFSAPPAGAPPPVPLRLSFTAAWVVSTLAWLLYNTNRGQASSASPIVWLIFAALALLPAYIIASALSGPVGVRSALSSFVRLRGRLRWYLLALSIPVAIRLASVWLSRQLGWELLSDLQVSGNPSQVATSVLAIFLYTLLYAGGLNEETGWTGLALPRLLARFTPLSSTIIVWALWMLWHVPMHLSGFFDLNLHVLIGSFFGRFLLTWLFIRSAGGVPTAILLHTSVNVTSQFVPVTSASLPVDAGVALLVIVGGRMWRRLPEERPAVPAEASLVALSNFG